MIKLSKYPEPEILAVNGPTWLKVIQDKIAVGEPPTETEKSRYRHPQIKDVLKLETHGKCAYCESRLLHVAFGDVEHIAPKSLKIADTFRWSNLTLACDVCNTYKKDVTNLIDPYVDNPGEYFKFLGPVVYPLPDKNKAIVTEKRLRLNRTDLVENRIKRLDYISSILLTIATASDPEVQAVLIDDLINNEAADKGEYAAFVRSFIEAMAPELTHPVI